MSLTITHDDAKLDPELTAGRIARFLIENDPVREQFVEHIYQTEHEIADAEDEGEMDEASWDEIILETCYSIAHVNGT